MLTPWTNSISSTTAGSPQPDHLAGRNMYPIVELSAPSTNLVGLPNVGKICTAPATSLSAFPDNVAAATFQTIRALDLPLNLPCNQRLHPAQFFDRGAKPTIS